MLIQADDIEVLAMHNLLYFIRLKALISGKYLDRHAKWKKQLQQNEICSILETPKVQINQQEHILCQLKQLNASHLKVINFNICSRYLITLWKNSLGEPWLCS